MSTKLFKLIQLFLFFVFIIKIGNCGCFCGKEGDGLDDDNDGGVVEAAPSFGQHHQPVQHVDPNQDEEDEEEDDEEEDDNEIHDAPDNFEFVPQGNEEEEQDDNQIPDAPAEDFEFFANLGEQNLPPLLQHPAADVEGFDEGTSGTTPGLTPQGGSTKGSTSSSP